MSVWENLQGLKGLNVVNLFAGMEVGRLACERAGVPIDKYYSSEIDKYAIQVSKANWPDIIHLGDVTKVYGCTLPDIHLLLGGSPCQGFSLAGKRLEFDDPRSSLFFEYLRVLEELKKYNPNIYFLLENVAGCGIFTEKFICKCCGKEINRNTVSDMLKAVYAESRKNKNMQRLLPGSKEEGTAYQFRRENKRGEEARIQPEGLCKSTGEMSTPEKRILPEEPGSYKSENGETPYDRQTQDYERWLYGFRQDGSQNEKISREVKHSDEARSGFRTERKDTKEYPETEISRTEERRHSATFGETENGRQQMPNLRNNDESSNRSHNPDNERGQERNIKSSESLQKVQHSKRQSVDVVCDKCSKESGYAFTATDFISALLGVKPYLINSALVSAQNRKRLYWTNIPFLGQPEDKGIVLKDILETNFSNSVIMSDKIMKGFDKRKANNVERGTGFGHVVADLDGKTNTLISRYGKDGKDGKECLIRLGNVQPSGRGMNGEVYGIEGKSPTLTTNKGESSKIGCYQVGLADDIKGFDANRRIYSQDGKAPTLISSTGGHKAPKIELLQSIASDINREDFSIKVLENGDIRPHLNDSRKTGISEMNTVCSEENKSVTVISAHVPKMHNGFTYRKLTVTECKRLQTVPDEYKMPVSNTQAYKMLGNGWTTDVITHLLLPLGDYSCLF